jgi:hypothetical protein
VADRGHRFTEGEESVHCWHQRWPTLDQSQNKSQGEIRYPGQGLCDEREVEGYASEQVLNGREGSRHRAGSLHYVRDCHGLWLSPDSGWQDLKVSCFFLVSFCLTPFPK